MVFKGACGVQVFGNMFLFKNLNKVYKQDIMKNNSI